MRDKENKIEIEEMLSKSIYTRIAFTVFIQELLKDDPDPQLTIQNFIKKYPCFKREMLMLSETLDLTIM